jgi:hypothetical protein
MDMTHIYAATYAMNKMKYDELEPAIASKPFWLSLWEWGVLFIKIVRRMIEAAMTVLQEHAAANETSPYIIHCEDETYIQQSSSRG